VAAALALNIIAEHKNTASIADDVTISAGGDFDMKATALTDAIAMADSTATNTQSDTGVAAAIALNVALVDNNATVGLRTHLTGSSIEIEAVTPGVEKNTIQARGLAGAAAKNTAVGGSIGLNYVEMDNHATVGNNSVLTGTAGGVSVVARSLSEL